MKRVTLTAVIWREGTAYVSHCPELGVASCGDSWDHALAMLKEAVGLYLDNAVQLGICEDIEAALNSPHRFTTPLEVTLP
jgi:predicted RNase H-like HicB family nuclease